MAAPPPVVVRQVGEVALEPDPIVGSTIRRDAPASSEGGVGSWLDGTETGVWRCLPGTFDDVEVDESFVVIEGRATVECEGVRHELRPGSICVFAAGAETSWSVDETLLKVYVLRPR